MTDTNVLKLVQPGTFSDLLTDVLRSGAHALLVPIRPRAALLALYQTDCVATKSVPYTRRCWAGGKTAQHRVHSHRINGFSFSRD